MSVIKRIEDDPVSYLIKGMPDRDELARLLLKAKGVNRTMAEFATQIGTNAYKCSRIANKKITQPVDPELLVRIAENADPEANIRARDLFLANGMELKEGMNGKPATTRRDIYSNPFYFAHEMINIVVSDLISRGNVLRKVRQIEDPSASRLIKTAGQSGVILSVAGCETEYWKFRMMDVPGFSARQRGFMTHSPGDMEEREHKRDYHSDAVLLLSRLAEVFLEDVWNPEKMSMCKMSFVFRIKAYYEAFNELVMDHKFNNWFSTILLDIEDRHVVEEFVFPRYDGNDRKSPLNYPIIEDDEDDYVEDSYNYEDDE